MTNRFSQLYKASAAKKSEQKLSLQLSKNQTAVEGMEVARVVTHYDPVLEKARY